MVSLLLHYMDFMIYISKVVTRECTLGETFWSNMAPAMVKNPRSSLHRRWSKEQATVAAILFFCFYSRPKHPFDDTFMLL